MIKLDSTLKLVDEGLGKKADAQELTAIASQLEQILAEVIEVEHPDLPASNGRMFEVSSELDPDINTYVYHVYEAGGLARIRSAYSSGTMPVASVKGAAVRGQIYRSELGYVLDVFDLREAAKTGQPVERMNIEAAERGHSTLAHQIFLWGREDLGMNGAANHPNANTFYTQPTGTGSSPLFADKTVDLVINDFSLIINGTSELTFKRHEVDTVAMSDKLYNSLNSRIVNTANSSNVTYLEMIKKAFPKIKDWIDVPDLRASLSDGNLTSDRIMAYKNDPRVIKADMPVSYEELEPDKNGAKIMVPTYAAIAGIRMPVPVAVSYLDGAATN